MLYMEVQQEAANCGAVSTLLPASGSRERRALEGPDLAAKDMIRRGKATVMTGWWGSLV